MYPLTFHVFSGDVYYPGAFDYKRSFATIEEAKASAGGQWAQIVKTAPDGSLEPVCFREDGDWMGGSL